MQPDHRHTPDSGNDTAARRPAHDGGDDATPTVSILVNNYNYGRYLGEALDSALRQMRAGDELIVVDDGSTDNSLDVLRDFECRHGITVVAQRNQGQLHATRVGIERARGDVLALLDSDDYFLPGYLDRLRAIYRAHPQVDCVFAAAEIGGEPLAAARMRRELARMALPAGVIGSTRWSTALLAEFVGVTTSGNSFRRDIARRAVTLPERISECKPIHRLLARTLRIDPEKSALTRMTADGLLVRATSMLGAIKFYDDRPGFFYRMHADNQYASLSSLGRWYVRRHRKRALIASLRRHYALPDTAPAAELRDEILRRQYSRHWRQRLYMRWRYLRVAVRSHGAAAERLAAIAAAVGLSRG